MRRCAAWDCPISGLSGATRRPSPQVRGHLPVTEDGSSTVRWTLSAAWRASHFPDCGHASAVIVPRRASAELRAAGQAQTRSSGTAQAAVRAVSAAHLLRGRSQAGVLAFEPCGDAAQE